MSNKNYNKIERKLNKAEMVLADLGAKMTAAMSKLNKKSTIDEATLNELLTDIAGALLSSDVNIHYINKLRNAVKTQVTL